MALADHRKRQEEWANRNQQRATLPDAYGEFLSKLADWDWFVTITFRDILPRDLAIARIEEWLADIQAGVGGRQIGWILAEEFGRIGGRYHCHMLVTGVYAFTRDDDYFFGVLHSRIHEVWSLHTCSWHGVGNDPTYNNTTCFETFPLPWAPGREPLNSVLVATIAASARELVEKRNKWLRPPTATEAELKERTLTNLYNARPEWLAEAHRKLDEAVSAAYGWPDTLTDAELLERLLKLNSERAAPIKHETK